MLTELKTQLCLSLFTDRNYEPVNLNYHHQGVAGQAVVTQQDEVKLCVCFRVFLPPGQRRCGFKS